MSGNSKKIYFASDFHLGAPSTKESLKREKLLVQWLEEKKENAKAFYLVGDIFDFWFEYKHVIPKGFVRLQGKIAELTDRGISIHFFTGNHDMWMFDYHEQELGIQMHREPIFIEEQGKRLMIGHGDGLGPGDRGYKFIKKVFANRFFQWCFARLHPNFGIGIANYFSKTSRAATGNADAQFLGETQEWLALYSKKILEEKAIDYFLFGHRHLPICIALTTKSQYFNLGDWLNYNTYGVLEDGLFQLKTYPNNQLYDFPHQH